jgi:hypothetical protein
MDVLFFYVLLFGILYMALCDFAMDPTKEHQILCNSRKKCDRDPGNDQTSGRGRKRETYTESPNSPRLKQARQVKIKVKRLLILFFDAKEIGHEEFFLAGQIVISAYYCDVLRRLCEICKDFSPKFGDISTGCCFTTTPSGTFFFTGEVLTKNSMIVISHPILFSVSSIGDKTERPPF